MLRSMRKHQFTAQPLTASQLGSEESVNLYIRELWEKLREYEDRLNASSRNSSRSPSSDLPKDKVERKKLQRLALEIRQALNQTTQDTNDHFQR